MKHTSRLVAASALVVVGGFALGGTASADGDAVQGLASGVTIGGQTPVGPITLPPTPQVTLPPLGGSDSDSVVDIPLPPAADVGVGVVDVSGSGVGTDNTVAQSSSTLTSVDAAAGNITADVVHAECAADNTSSSGTASLVNAVVGGNPVAAAPPPNTGTNVGGLVGLMLNEQENTDGPGQTHTSVSAIHAMVAIPMVLEADIVLAHAECGVTSSPDTPGGTGGPGGPGGPGTPGRIVTVTTTRVTPATPIVAEPDLAG